MVDKPAGLVVHPAAGNLDGTLVNALLHHCAGQLSGINGRCAPGIVHRIDKDTSGLLVVAKSDAAHEGLARQFADHSIERTYLAVCAGHPQPGRRARSPRASAARTPTARRWRCCPTTSSRGKHAVTHYRTLRPLERLRAGRMPAGDRAHPPGPGSPCVNRSSAIGRSCLWTRSRSRCARSLQELGFRPPGASRREPRLRPSGHRRTARLFERNCPPTWRNLSTEPVIEIDERRCTRTHEMLYT